MERTTKNIHIKAMKILAMSTVLKAEIIDSIHTAGSVQIWDNDSGLIGIDNRFSACMSQNPTDFIGELYKYRRIIKDFGGQTYTHWNH